jgi:murein DD-endopeptidase MepM/ murein hydrolase activator NlpD
MKNEITCIILRDSGSKINQVSFTRFFLFTACALAGIFFVGLLSVSFAYITLKQTGSDTEVLRETIAHQSAEIASQRDQIQKFIGQINTVKSNLLVLKQFEKKIRIIANIEASDDSESLFGIGGSIFEDTPGIIFSEEENDRPKTAASDKGPLHESASPGRGKAMNSTLKEFGDRRTMITAPPDILPTRGWISSRFGYRQSPLTGNREFHKGIDFATREGTPVQATADGAVTYAGNRGLLGMMIILDHGLGISTRYGHCSQIMKKGGDLVKKGDIIAYAGTTGHQKGPRLHYEVRLNSVQVNPAKYLPDQYAGKKDLSPQS